MLTLDEAITRFKAGAVANRSRAESYNRGEDYEMLKAKSCEICADECDQVASWLEELKERREKESELKPTKDLINDIVGFDVSEIKPLPDYKESEATNED